MIDGYDFAWYAAHQEHLHANSDGWGWVNPGEPRGEECRCACSARWFVRPNYHWHTGGVCHSMDHCGSH